MMIGGEIFGTARERELIKNENEEEEEKKKKSMGYKGARLQFVTVITE